MVKIKDRILIVENNPEISDFLANQALVSRNFQIFQVADASSAINKAVQINPDLIITNLNLPGLSGKDLIIALTSHGITPPTIMIAMEGQEAEIIQAFRIGAADYITWPTQETEVLLVAERLLQQVHERREHVSLENQLKTTNQQLQQRVKELTAIYTIGKAVTSITDHKILFDKILQISAQVSQSDLGWLLMKQEEKGNHFLLVSQYNLPEVLNSKMNNVWDDGISKLVAISGETLNISGDPIKRFKVRVFGESIIIIPVKIHRQVVGLLVLMRRNNLPFSESEQRLLESVADYASISLINARLFRSYEARERALSSLVTQSQINESIFNELLSKTKESLAYFSSAIKDKWMDQINFLSTNADAELKEQIQTLNNVVFEIQNLPTFLTPEPGLFENHLNKSLNLVELLRYVVQQFAPIVDHYQLKFHTDFLVDSIKIYADPDHMYEALKGILVNAIQFCEPQGTISVQTTKGMDASAIISISNTGKIPEKHNKQIFSNQNPAEKQSKLRFGGIGISLPLIYTIVTQYQGKIWIQNQPNYGTTFVINLPNSESN